MVESFLGQPIGEWAFGIATGLAATAIAAALAYWFGIGNRFKRLHSAIAAWMRRPPQEPYVRLLIADLEGDDEKKSNRQDLEEAFAASKERAFEGFRVSALEINPYPTQARSEPENLEKARANARSWLQHYDADLCLFGRVTGNKDRPYRLYFESRHDNHADDGSRVKLVGRDEALELPRKFTHRLKQRLAVAALAILAPPDQRRDPRERYYERFLEPQTAKLERLIDEVAQDLPPLESATIYRALGRACLTVLRMRSATPEAEGWVERAEKALNDASARFKAEGDVNAYAHTLCDLGNVYLEEEDSQDKATSSFASALESGSNDETVFWRAQTGLAESEFNARSDVNRHVRAIERLRSFYKNISADRDPLRLSQALQVLGWAYTHSAHERNDFRTTRKAVACLRWARKLVDRERDPLLWARRTSKLAWAMSTRARLLSDPVGLRLASRVAREALAVFDPEREPNLWRGAQFSLCDSLAAELRLTNDAGIRDETIRVARDLIAHAIAHSTGSSHAGSLSMGGVGLLTAWKTKHASALIDEAISAFEEAGKGLLNSGEWNEAVLREVWAEALINDPTITSRAPIDRAIEHATRARELFEKWGTSSGPARCDKLLARAREKGKHL